MNKITCLKSLVFTLLIVITLHPGSGFAAAQNTPPPSVRIGGDVAQANLLSSVQPIYPQEAREARIQGVVVMQVNIDKAGLVGDVRILSGHPLLNQAAIDAVKQWKYRPFLLNGQPVDVVTTVSINFSLQ